MRALISMAVLWAALFSQCSRAADGIVVGSKIFTEGYILGEIAAQAIESTASAPVIRKLGMGSTGILFESLKSGSIDVYADYTGTLAEAIIKRPELRSFEQIQEALKPLGLVISRPLGFNNTYALAVKADFADKNGLHSISDLVQMSSKIKAAFSYEFMDRSDGYRGMTERYQLNFLPQNVNRMEHSLTYQAINERVVDVIDVYSTDAKIGKLGLRVLTDDLGYFPVYQAVWVARKSFVAEHPMQWQALVKLEGAIDDRTMRDMNAQADIEKKSFDSIASSFLGLKTKAAQTFWSKIIQRSGEHLWLVFVSLVFSILIGIPLGIAATRFRAAGQGILVFSALVQTIPSLALLCFLIPLFGVGTKPALAALCLYSLLPVVLNTFTGIRSIDPRHLENARAFGLNRSQVLLRIVLPLASPMLLAGIKNATIVSIGTATLAALVGAGGYGAPIVSGLALNDMPTILTGAVPAAVMALFAYGLFELLDRVLIPTGIRRQTRH